MFKVTELAPPALAHVSSAHRHQYALTVYPVIVLNQEDATKAVLQEPTLKRLILRQIA
jgi:hypothetical protein